MYAVMMLMRLVTKSFHLAEIHGKHCQNQYQQAYITPHISLSNSKQQVFIQENYVNNDVNRVNKKPRMSMAFKRTLKCFLFFVSDSENENTCSNV